jgi:signal transduction histidine kinase
MRLRSSQRIWAALTGSLLLAAIGSGAALFSAWRNEQVFRQMLTVNVQQAQAMYELEIALLEQGVATSLYLMGGNPEWLTELRQKRPEFEARLKATRTMDLGTDEEDLVERIAKAFTGFDAKSRQAVALYSPENPEQAKNLWLEQALTYYDHVRSLCEGLSIANTRDIEQAIAAQRAQVKRVNLWIIIFLWVLAVLIAGLVVSLSRGMFRPLRHLVDSATAEQTLQYSESSPEEIRSLGAYIDNLRGEVADMRSRLSASQRRLLDAEKLATIGKLAATVAHEIRSPLTSLSLRLFSVQRAFGDSDRQRDFQLISEEITRLDGIVRSLLEFTKPRQPVLKDCDVRQLLEQTVELLTYKLEATNIAVARHDEGPLPHVLGDPQQLKQVFVNLLNNAVEALHRGGRIDLTTCRQRRADGTDIVCVLVRDDGPGIPVALRQSLFDPFTGTKEEGTGLGLWIARRIMTEHGGGIELEQSAPPGTTFCVWLPASKENGHE